MKPIKISLALTALFLPALVWGNDDCPCPGEQPYAGQDECGTDVCDPADVGTYPVDCDGDGVGDKCSVEDCCNSDAGDPAEIDESIDLEKSLSVGPYEIDLPGDCGTVNIPKLVGVEGSIKGSASGVANPLVIPLSMTISGTSALPAVTYSITGVGNAKRYVYIACEGLGCDGPYEGGKPSYEVDFSIKFTFVVCGPVSWTTPAINAGSWSKELDAVEFEKCLPNGA